MPTQVFLTIDTELMWRHHVAGLDPAEVVARSFEPAGVGVGWQLERLAAHGLKACFFVDPMPALVHGLEPIAAVVLPTAHFADRPALALGQDDAPLAPSLLRTRLRQAEQLWSNLAEEPAE